MKTPIEDAGLSMRAYNALRNENYKYLEDIHGKTCADMLRIPNVGHGTLKELMEALQKRGLYLDRGHYKEPADSTATEGRYWTHARLQAATEMLEKGFTNKEVATAFNSSPSSMLAALRKYGYRKTQPSYTELMERVKYLERELSEERHSREVAAQKAWEFADRIKELEKLNNVSRETRGITWNGNQ